MTKHDSTTEALGDLVAAFGLLTRLPLPQRAVTAGPLGVGARHAQRRRARLHRPRQQQVVIAGVDAAVAAQGLVEGCQGGGWHQ